MSRRTAAGYALAFRLRRLFLPVLLAAVLSALGCSLVHWLLLGSVGELAMLERVLNFALPAALALVLAIGLVPPRVRFLVLSKPRQTRSMYFLVALAVIALPSVIAQRYVAAAAGGLVRIASARDIETAPSARFYASGSVCLEPERSARQLSTRFDNPHGHDIVATLYTVLPVCGAAAPRRTWIGILAQSQVPWSRYSQDRTAITAALGESAAAWIREANGGRIEYLERPGPGDDRDGFDLALRAADPPAAANAAVLIARFEPFSARGARFLTGTMVALAAGVVTWLAMVLLPKLHRDSGGLVVATPAAQKSDWRVFAAMLTPRPSNYGLALLVDANIGVFAAMALTGIGFLSFSAPDLMKWGANFRPGLHGLGWLRLISSQFVHVGFKHLLGNLYGLLFAGIFLSPILPNWRLIACYLICGTAASLTSAYMHPATLSVGASGAIFGLFGVLVALLGLRDERVWHGAGAILINVAIYLAINLAIGFAVPGIDNAAHVGGFLMGLVLGAILRFTKRSGFDPPGAAGGGDGDVAAGA